MKNFARNRNQTRAYAVSAFLAQKQWRLMLVLSLVLVVGAIIVLRLYSLQVLAHEDYRALATNQHRLVSELVPERGEVYLQNGEELYPLAINREYKMAYAVPREVEDHEKTIALLVSTLSLDQDLVRAKIYRKDDIFEILKHRLSNEEIASIEALALPGIELLPESYRFYPGGQLGAHLIGFVGSDGQENHGRYGIEAAWDKKLSGEHGDLRQERDARGGWIAVTERILNPAHDGVDLVLTMPYNVQFEVERILQETVQKHGADQGSIIVVEPKTGKVLALANYPTFNPNTFGEIEDHDLFVNDSVSLPYEPGSVFKPLTMAIGLDQEVVTPEATFVDPGSIRAGGFEIKNSEEKTYGRQTMTQVLEESINTGAVHVEKLIGHKTFADYVEHFGFGAPSNIDLPLDVSGNTRNLTFLNRTVEFYTASFGQGITMTPLQLAYAYAALANGGNLMRPQIVEKIVHPDGYHEEVSGQVVRRVISQEASHQIGQMLESVVVNGHGKRAGVPGYRVGGKTGTAQVANTQTGGYEENVTIGTFAGYAPIEDPQFVVVVKIDNPKDVIWAESSAAPAFGRVMEYLLEHYNVEPTAVEQEELATQ